MSSSRRRRCHSGDGNTSGIQGDRQNTGHTSENGDRLQREHFLKPDSDQIDLNLLLDAVLDINKKLRTQEQNDRESDDDLSDRASQLNATEKRKDNRFLEEMLNPVSKQERDNYSFRNDQVFDIDRENQRLLKEITRRRPRSAHTTRHRSSQTAKYEPPRLKTSSEVNRMRFQKKIEQENQALLCRIQAAKPDKSLNREQLMKDQVKPRVRPSSASGRMGVSRPGTSASMSTRTMSLRDYHYGSTLHDASTEKSNFSPRPAVKKSLKPSWEAGW